MNNEEGSLFDRGKVESVIGGMFDAISEHDANMLEAYQAAKAVKASLGDHLRRAIGDDKFSSVDQ